MINDVAEDFFAIPFGEGFAGGFGEAEVDGAGEILFGAIDAARGEEFLGTDEAHPFALFAADEILAAFASREGQVGCAVLPAAGGEGEEGGVFVVGVGGDVEDFAEAAEFFDLEAEGGGAGEGGLGLKGCQEQGKEEGAHVLLV